MLKAIGDPPIACELWNGEKIHTCVQKPRACLRFNNRQALIKVLRNPERYFGDCYTDKLLDVVEGDLLTLLLAIYEKNGAGSAWRETGRNGFRLSKPRARRNTLKGSRENIHHHYDIGNDFYRLWLDKEMQYTCAYFPREGMNLEDAQLAKMEHICRKLQLRPGQTVVEAGCGWGGLSRYMAKNYGVTVKAYNISSEQVKFARECALREGLQERVQYIEDDYRTISGQYDVFVSVGMLEHVGVENYPELGGLIDRCLKPNGRGLIHTIGRNRPRPMNSWIERRIFPGARPPAISEMMQIFEEAEFSILDLENLRLHYEKTLSAWLSRYETAHEQVENMFDEHFLRAWRLYLAGSILAFHIGELQLFQVVFTRKRNNDIPWNREHLYL
jgi:cyclopropane-fatty-acyl-phospholipid synthase